MFPLLFSCLAFFIPFNSLPSQAYNFVFRPVPKHIATTPRLVPSFAFIETRPIDTVTVVTDVVSSPTTAQIHQEKQSEQVASFTQPVEPTPVHIVPIDPPHLPDPPTPPTPPPFERPARPTHPPTPRICSENVADCPLPTFKPLPDVCDGGPRGCPPLPTAEPSIIPAPILVPDPCRFPNEGIKQPPVLRPMFESDLRPCPLLESSL